MQNAVYTSSNSAHPATPSQASGQSPSGVPNQETKNRASLTEIGKAAISSSLQARYNISHKLP